VVGAVDLPLGLLGLREVEDKEGRLSTIRCRGEVVEAAGFSPLLKNS
jgi:hypothetical protein